MGPSDEYLGLQIAGMGIYADLDSFDWPSQLLISDGMGTGEDRVVVVPCCRP